MSSAAAQPTNPIDQIKIAFHADDAVRVRELIATCPELRSLINEPIGPFDSPAILNVRSRAMLDVLIEAGADLNAKSRWWAGGFGLLHVADPDLCKYAIGRGAIVDLHAAARLGMMDGLQEIVRHDPQSVHARGGDGQTPLHFSATVEIAAHLLDHGAEIDALDVDHESTPAQYMIDDRQEIVRFLIARGCKCDILMAAAVGDQQLVRRHLDADSESIRMTVSDEYFPMIGGKTGGTIYQWKLGWYVSPHRVARKYGHWDVLQLLLERSPPAIQLIDACWMRDAPAATQLQRDHSDVLTTLTAADRRHIAHAARNNETEVVRLMLDCGLPVNATSQHNGTPLHWAAFHGNHEMTRLILGYKPSLEVTDRDFASTPLGWAIYGSEHGWCCQSGDYPGTVQGLLEAGAICPATLSGTSSVQEVLRQYMNRDMHLA